MEDPKTDLDTFSKCWRMVLFHYQKDHERANAWFLAANQSLGGNSPIKMFQMGKVNELHNFIRICLGED